MSSLTQDDVIVVSAVRTPFSRFDGLLKSTDSIDLGVLALKEVVSQDKGPEYFLADATLYLELFGIISIAWQWLLQAISIQKALKNELPKAENNFYQGKFYAFRYFFAYELPKIGGLVKRLSNSDGLTVEMKDEWFAD